MKYCSQVVAETDLPYNLLHGTLTEPSRTPGKFLLLARQLTLSLVKLVHLPTSCLLHGNLHVPFTDLHGLRRLANFEKFLHVTLHGSFTDLHGLRPYEIDMFWSQLRGF